MPSAHRLRELNICTKFQDKQMLRTDGRMDRQTDRLWD